MASVDHAIILAAGEGSRLRPFTADKPKPMIRAANKPILQHIVESLVATGIRDITLVVGYHREKVQAYFGDGNRYGASIQYAFQDRLTGTADALARAPAPKGSFLVLSGDNVIDASLVKAALSAPGEGPAMVVHRSDRPQRYGVVSMDGDRVARIVEKPAQPSSEWVNTGLYRLPAEFHARASRHERAGIPDLIQAAVKDGKEVRAVRSEHLWADAVYPWDLLRVHAEVQRLTGTLSAAPPGVTIEAPVLIGDDTLVGPGSHLAAGTCIGDHVVIGSNCVIENSVIYDDVQIGPGAVLRNTIVGAGTRIGPRFSAISGPTDIRSVDGWHHLDDFGAIIGEDARIGGAVTCLPGTILGNRVGVAHAKTLAGSVDDSAKVL